MAKKTSTGVAGLIGQAAKTATASASKTPQVQVPDALAPHVQAFVEAHRDEKLAESRKKDAAAQLVEFARAQRITLSRKAGECHSSVKLTTKSGEGCKFTSSKRFTGMKVVDGTEEILQAAFGKRYDDYFSVAPQIKIKSITDEQASKLVEALTKAGLMDLLEVNPIVKGNDRLFDDMVLNPRIAAITDQVSEQDGLCKPVVSFRL